MMDVKITKDCYVPKEKVKFYCSYDSAFAKRLMKEMREKGGTVINATESRRPALSVVVMDDWTVFKVNTAPQTLNERMNAEKEAGR